MNKHEVQKRVTKKGQLLDVNNFDWDEKTRVFSSNESGLVFDFTNIDGCTFKTGHDCTFKTGSDCTFKTGFSCTFKTGLGCTFNTGLGCTFNTGPDCTFNTNHDCTFKTGSDCIFYIGDEGKSVLLSKNDAHVLEKGIFQIVDGVKGIFTWNEEKNCWTWSEEEGDIEDNVYQ